jgi:uncharacterized protein YigE (DUF2233 family)
VAQSGSRYSKFGVPQLGHVVKNFSRLGLTLFAFLIPEVSVRAEPALCQFVTFEHSEYTVCEVDLRRQSVRLFWKKPDGRELVRANTSAGPGNFHMRPNGVFYLAGEVAGILETRSFIKRRPQVDFATQSGPMLVIDGEINAPFVRYGGSRKYRAGVGSRDPNLVLFAISESEISFDEFARLFRDKLQCNNALFLDGGSATSFYSAVLGRNSNFLPLGPIIGVYGPD